MACTIYAVASEDKAKPGNMARPRLGDWLEDELLSVSQQHFEVIVSLLEEEEAAELDLNDESSLSAWHGIQFVRIPISDRGVQTAVEREASGPCVGGRGGCGGALRAPRHPWCR